MTNQPLSGQDIWKEHRLIESYDVDIMGRLRAERLFAYLLSAAWSHARSTQYGYDQLSARNLMWVLVKAQIAIKRLPIWGERVLVQTWGKGMVKLYALRDFTVTSPTGGKLVSATSAWAILDRATGKSQRFHEKPGTFQWRPGMDEMLTNLKKVQASSNGQCVARYRVLFSDLDVNRHVTAARYLQWMIDSHPYERLEAVQAKSIELSFLSEARPNEKVEVFSEEKADQELCSVRRIGDGKELCRGRFEWRRACGA